MDASLSSTKRTHGQAANSRRVRLNVDGVNAKRVLVIDVGGTSVKFVVGNKQHRSFPSGPDMTPKILVNLVKKQTDDWHYQAVAIGYPGLVLGGQPVAEPRNLAPGWVGFDYTKALGHQVKILNDAAMQALGSYQGGKMLFLGLGTGLGTTMIVDGIVEPLELGHLPYRKRTYEDYVGRAGLKKHGKKRWRKHVTNVISHLVAALEPEDTVIGGGNVDKLRELPFGCRGGKNGNAFIGGFRMWQRGAERVLRE